MAARHLTEKERIWLIAMGEALRQERVRQNLTRREVAKRANVTESMINAFERGLANNAFVLYHVAKVLIDMSKLEKVYKDAQNEED